MERRRAPIAVGEKSSPVTKAPLREAKRIPPDMVLQMQDALSGNIAEPRPARRVLTTRSQAWNQGKDATSGGPRSQTASWSLLPTISSYLVKVVLLARGSFPQPVDAPERPIQGCSASGTGWHCVEQGLGSRR